MINVAKTAGFCFGVGRAVEIAEDTAIKYGRVLCLGPLIHNKGEVDRLTKLGVNVIEQPEEAGEGDTVIIRSHGVPLKTEQILLERNVNVIDATCPFVKRIHKIVEEQIQNGYQIVIVGDAKHPEVLGINGRCEERAIVISDEDEIFSKIKPSLRVCVVAQTTFNRLKWKKILNLIKNTCKDTLFF